MQIVIAGLLLLSAARMAQAQLPGPRSSGSSISGTVFDSLVTRRPLSGAEVVVVESGRSALSDSLGRFRFDGVAAGSVHLAFYRAVLDSLGIGATPVPVIVPAAGEIDVALVTPSPSTLHRQLCPDAADATTGAVVGRVRNVDDQTAVADAEISVWWTEWRIGSGGLTRAERREAARSDSAGAFRLCGVPTDVPVATRAAKSDQATGLVQLDLSQQPFLVRDLALSLRDTTARLRPDTVATAMLVRIDSLPAAAGSAMVTGVVRTPDNRPVKDAQASVLGAPLSIRTDSAGNFRLTGLPAGTQSLDVRALGYSPVRIAVDLPTGGQRDVMITLDRNAHVLAPVTIVGSGTIFDRTGFETRRRRGGFGRFITDEEIRRRGVFDTGQLFATMAGFTTAWNGSTHVPLMRGSFGEKKCAPVVFIDGFQGHLDDIRPRDIRGIEVYASAGAAPTMLRDPIHQCGSTIIWTRPRPRRQ